MSSESGAGENGKSDCPVAEAEGRGMLVVVSSPSGGGKGTLIQRALAAVPNLGYSVSWTTRHPREGEVEGRDYYFTTPEKFEEMRRKGEFIEWASVHGNLYGTARHEVEHQMAGGRDVILEIDVQGATNVRRAIGNHVSVFILPPSFEALRARLAARASETPDTLTLRLSNARTEIEHYRSFDYIVLNDVVERAAAELIAIIYAERARRERQEVVAQAVLASFSKSSQAA